MTYVHNSPPGTYDHRGAWCARCGDQSPHYRPYRSIERFRCTVCDAVEGQVAQDGHTVAKTDVGNVLHHYWLRLRRGHSAGDHGDVAFVRGAIGLAFDIGLITSDSARVWLRTIDGCPGHADGMPRGSCAYCADAATTGSDGDR